MDDQRESFVEPRSRNVRLYTPAMEESLTKTRPWVKFLGVLGLVMSGLMVLVGLGIVVVSAVVEFNMPQILFGILYLFLAGVYVLPSMLLLRYAGAIARIPASAEPAAAIEEALDHQRAFWKFAGVFTLIMMGLYALALVIGIALGIGLSMFGSSL